MLKLNHLLYLFGICLFWWACNRSEPTRQSMYIKPADEKLDRYCTYLADPQKYTYSGYMNFAYSRFQQLLQAQKIDSAAQVLFWAGKTIRYNSEADSNFIHTVIGFQKEHERQLSDRYFVGLHMVVGCYYYDLGDFDRATHYFSKTKIQAKDFYTYDLIAEANYRLIFTHLNNGRNAKALVFGQQALDMFTKLKDTSMMGSVCSGIACIYRYIQDYPEAEQYENKAFLFLQQTTDSHAILTASLNKLSLYAETDEHKLLAFIDTTFAFFQAMPEKYPADSLSVYSWKAFKLVKINQLPTAKRILDALKPIYASTNDEISKDYFINAWSEYELKIGRGPSDPSFYIQQIPELLEYEDYLRLQTYADILIDGFKDKKDYAQAYKYAEIHQSAHDSLTKKELRNTVKELDKKYQTAKKEQQIHLQQAEIKKQNAFISLLFVALIGVLLSTIIYYLWLRQKRLQQAQSNSLNYTKQLLENTEEERRRIASDLHDSISHELLNLKTTLTQGTNVVNNKIDTIINDIRGISRNLHPVMFDKIGLQPNLEQLVERVEQQQHFLVSTEIDYSGNLPSATELQLYRIVQEALSNTIKYAKAHAAKITLQEKPGELFVEIRDNGQGFDVSKTLNSGKAFGLHNIIERSRVIGGKAQLHSSNTGTIISISIPYSTTL